MSGPQDDSDSPDNDGLRMRHVEWTSPDGDSPLIAADGALPRARRHDAVSQILPWLFIGAANSVHSAALNSASPVSDCSFFLCCCEEMSIEPPEELLRNSRVRFKRMMMKDGDDASLLAALNDCDEFIESARLACRGIVVYCQRGVSRSPSVVISYLMRRQNLTFEQALEFVRRQRPQADPNAAFVGALLSRSR
jgi:hypothetical protein